MLQLMRHANTRAVAECILVCLRLTDRPPHEANLKYDQELD